MAKCVPEIIETTAAARFKITAAQLDTAITNKTKLVVLHCVGKAYSMTGKSICYAAEPHQLIATMKKIQSQSTSNPTSISLIAAQAALKSDL